MNKIRKYWLKQDLTQLVTPFVNCWNMIVYIEYVDNEGKIIVEECSVFDCDLIDEIKEKYHNRTFKLVELLKDELINTSDDICDYDELDENYDDDDYDSDKEWLENLNKIK